MNAPEKLTLHLVLKRGQAQQCSDSHRLWYVNRGKVTTGEAPINLMNGEQDRQGVGLFARFGIADQDTNTIEWTGSGGLGGKGLIPGRERDTFGVGFFYLSVQPDRLLNLIGVEDHSHGFEAYYNLSITPAANLSLDIQIVDSPFSHTDTAVILGLRLGLKF